MSAPTVVGDDALGFLLRDERRFDLILVDPPTFSNSKRAPGFDVQRDPLRRLERCAPRLTPGARPRRSAGSEDHGMRGEQADERLNDRRVEVRARAATQLGDRVVSGARRRVDARGRHRRVGVDDGDDARG